MCFQNLREIISNNLMSTILKNYFSFCLKSKNSVNYTHFYLIYFLIYNNFIFTVVPSKNNVFYKLSHNIKLRILEKLATWHNWNLKIKKKTLNFEQMSVKNPEKRRILNNCNMFSSKFFIWHKTLRYSYKFL